MNQDDKQVLMDLVNQSRSKCSEGKVADYIPMLARASGETLGIAIHRMGEHPIVAGDSSTVFTMQSISKVFTLVLALMDWGEESIFEKVGMEPTGDNFNSMVKLELVEPGRPFNPMINAGAIAITSLIKGSSSTHKFRRILAFIRKVAGDNSLVYDQEVFESEVATADRNRSLGYFLKHNHFLEGNVEAHLQVYFKHCSIAVNCKHLARMAMIMANDGIDPDNGKAIIPRRYVQIAKVFMISCGMYNASGEFAIQVGIPAKSGVSGGIMAIVPGKMGISVIGPALSAKGNSVAGVHLLQKLSEKWRLNMF
jgi:glutaminase